MNLAPDNQLNFIVWICMCVCLYLRVRLCIIVVSFEHPPYVLIRRKQKSTSLGFLHASFSRAPKTIKKIVIIQVRLQQAEVLYSAISESSADC